MENNTSFQKSLIIGGVVIITLLFLGFLFMSGTRDEENRMNSNLTDEINQVQIGDITINNLPEGVTIEPVEGEGVTALDIPNLDRLVTIPAHFPPEAVTIARENIQNTVSRLREDATSFNDWIELGNLRAQIEDYEGARIIYQFLSDAVPGNFVSFLNLGNLYHLRFRDYPNAEANLKKALVNNRASEQAYMSLHELYRYSYKQNTTLAADILKEGVDFLPDSANLPYQLGLYYKGTGDAENARIYLEQAKGVAERTGYAGLVDIINAELGNL